jgi:hypothetical protein
MTQTGAEKSTARTLEAIMTRLGKSPAVDRFLGGYAKLNTKHMYAYQLLRYFEWLRDKKEVSMSPDQLVQDNLEAVFGSPPTDVKAKRKHMDWVNSYVNEVILNEGWPEVLRLRSGRR